MRTRPPGILVRLLIVLAAATGTAAVGAPAASAAKPENGFTCEARSLDVTSGPLGVVLDPLLNPIEDLIAVGGPDEECGPEGASPLGGALGQVTGALRGLGIDLGALTTETTVDTTKAQRDRTPASRAKVAGLSIGLPFAGALLTVDAVESRVSARCVDGRAQFTSTFDVGDITAFGKRVDLDLTQPVTQISGALGALGPVLRLTPGAVVRTADGERRTALRVQLLELGLNVLDVSIAVSDVQVAGTACDPALAPTVDAPAVDGRTIGAAVTPPAGTTIAACAFRITPRGGAETTVDGTYDAVAQRCTAPLPRADFPAGDYVASATASTADGGAATSVPADFALTAPTVGTPALSGRELSVPAAPGSGATVTSCEIALGPDDGPATTLSATYDTATGRCRATLPPGAFPAGDYVARTTVTDSAGDTASARGTVTTGGPTVGAPTLTGRTLSAALAPAAGTTVVTCEFRVVPDGGGASRTVAGTVTGDACTATLPRATFPAGGYTFLASATDSEGGSASRAGAGTIAGPSVGAPVLDDLALSVPVTPGSGETVRDCAVVVTRTGGTAVSVPATYDAAAQACVATLPSDLRPGTYEVATTVTDSGGETGTGTGPVTLHGATVGVPSIDGRTVSATVDAESGTTAGTCEFRLTPTGGAARTVAGTVAAGRCSAALPAAEFPAGAYDIVVAVTDSAGRRRTNTGSGTIPADPVPPVVVVGPPTIDVRDVGAPVTVPDGTTITDCTVVVTPKAGGPAVTVPGRLEGGRCVATLPAATVPPGDYDVVVTVTEGGGKQTSSSGTVTVAGPTVGTPIGIGPVVVVPVTPGAGGTVTACSLTVTPVPSGTPRTVTGTYDPVSGTCAAALPSGDFPTGAYDVATTVTDSNGSKATGSGRIAVTQPTERRVADAADVAQSLLACEGGKLALIEARLAGSRVRLSGVALKALAGRTIQIRLSAKGIATRTVARPKVAADGTFATSVKAPARRLRATTARAKYYAVVESTRSQALRLTRRTNVTTVTQRGGRVTVSGRISSPVPRAGTPVVIGRRVSCTTYRTVARGTTDRRGRFSVTFTAPSDRAAGLYRAQTRAPSKAGQPARNRTFTLPQIIVPR